jgi:ADP-ribose pyrophosphatase
MVKERSDVEVIRCEDVYQGYLKVRRYRLRHRLFDGSWSTEMTREVMERAHAVAVLPYDPTRDEVVLIEQFRMGIFDAGHDPWSIECVAGLIEADESLEDVAYREVEEETGLEVTALQQVHRMYASPGVFSEHVWIYVARVDASEAGGIFGLDHEHEDIRAFTCPLDQALKMLDDGQILVSHSLIALQWLALHRDEMRRRWS